MSVNFKEITDHLNSNGGDYTSDKQLYQFIIFQRAGNALRALKVLVENQAWDGAYGRVRYLMECYLLLRALNRDQDQAARLLEKTSYELRVRGNVGPEQRLVEETELGDILENERGKLGNREKRLYNYLSNRAMHPHTISSANVPGRYSSVVERDCLQSGAFFGFAVLAQLVRTYEETDGWDAVRLSVDPVIVDIWTFTERNPPAMLLSDLDLFEPWRFS